MTDDVPFGWGFAPKRACMSSCCFGGTTPGTGGLVITSDTSVLVRRAAFTAEGSVEASASIEPKALTVSARWAPVVEGAAGDDDNRGLGESTVPKAILPTELNKCSVLSCSPLLISIPPPTIRLPFRECPAMATGTGPFATEPLRPLPLAPAPSGKVFPFPTWGSGESTGRVGVGISDDRLDEGLEVWAGGGPRDQTEDAIEGVGVVALLVVWMGGVATLLIEE